MQFIYPFIIHNLFIHSSTGEPEGCFQVRASKNRAPVNVYTQVFEYMLSFLLWKYLQVGLLGNILSVCLTS